MSPGDSAGFASAWNAITASVAVTLAESQINVGATTKATAEVRDASRRLLPWRRVTWLSSNPAVATVTSKGIVEGVAVGTAQIVASSGGKSGSATITVKDTAVKDTTTAPPPAPAKVASVVVTLAASSIEAGKTTTVSVSVRDSSNNVLTDRAVSWSSSNTAVARIDTATKTVTGVAAGTANIIATSEGVSGQAAITVTAPPPPTVSNCGSVSGGIWCDDFETDRLSSYFEVATAGGSFARVAGVGRNGSYGMRARFAAGQVDAGNMKLAFGRTPSTSFKPVDGGTKDYREIYWRVYVRNAPNWTGGGDKFGRATVFATSNWAQAMIAHTWGGGAGPDENYLVIDPASGTDAAGNLKTTKYNDFANLRWLGAARSATPILDNAHSGQWSCVESHIRLNTSGQSDGLFELRINGALEASRTGLNFLGSYSAYGLNAIFLENYWNAGSPVAQERYFDDFVVSEQPIGCDASAPTSPTPLPASKLSLPVQPSASAVNAVAFAQQPKVQLVDANGVKVSQSGVSVAAAIASGGGTLGGTTSVTTDAAGVANFSNLSITGTVGARTLVFSAGSMTSATSSSISVTAGAATQLAFATTPSSSTTSGAVLAQQPSVRLRDVSGNAVSQSGVVVTAAITAGGGTLGGTLTATTSSTGVATFTNLSITGTDGSRTLSFSAPGLASVSAVVSVTTATTTPPPTTGSNEPSGFTVLSQRSFTSKTDAGWMDTGASAFSIQSVMGPQGDGKVGQALFPAGFAAGSAPINTYYNVSGTYKQLYVGMWIKFSSNWQGQSAGVNKILFIWIDGSPNVFLNAQGVGSGTLVPSINLQNNVGGAVRLSPNVVSSATFTRGEWHYWEVLLVANSVGQLNGSAKWWLDGKLIGSYTGIGPARDGSNRWETVAWNPTWGGAGGTVSADMTQQIDQIKVSGAP